MIQTIKQTNNQTKHFNNKSEDAHKKASSTLKSFSIIVIVVFLLKIHVIHQHSCTHQKSFCSHIDVIWEFNFECVSIRERFCAPASPFFLDFAHCDSSSIFNLKRHISSTSYGTTGTGNIIKFLLI